MRKVTFLFPILIVVCLGLFGVGLSVEGFGNKATAQDEGLGFYARELWTLDHEGEPVHSIAFSPDEKLLATATDNGSIKVWAVEKGEILRNLEGHSEPVLSLSFSPGGKYLASGSADSTVKVWKVREGKCIYTFEGHKAAVNSVAFSPDSKLLVSGSDDEAVKIWDLARGNCRRTIEGHTGPINSLVFYPDGTRLATAGEDMTVMLWLPGNWPIIRELRGHKAPISCLWVSPDGNRLASASADGRIIFWDVPSGMPRSTLKLKARVNSFGFSPDDKIMVAATSSKNVPVWDAKTGKVIRVLKGHEDEVTSVSFSPKGRLLASASKDGKVNLWEVKWRRKLTVWGRREDSINALSFSPDGKFLALGYAGKDIVKLLNMRTGKVTKVLEMGKRGRIRSGVQCVRFSPDGKILAVGGWRYKEERDRRHSSTADKGIILLWDGEEERELPEVDMPDRLLFGVTSLSFSANGRLLVARYYKYKVKIWDVAEEKCLWTAASASFSADGRLLAAGYDDGEVKIWDVAEEEYIRTFTLPTDDFRFFSVSLSPDGHFVAAWGVDEIEKPKNLPVVVWDVRTGKGPKLLSGAPAPMSRLSFSRDGRILVARDYSGNIIFWDVATWRKVQEIRPGNHPKMVFSPDGKLLAVRTAFGGGKARGKVTLFDVEKGKLIKLLGKGGHPPGAMTFSPDGATLAVVYNTYEAKQMARGIRFDPKESYLGLWWLPGCLDQWPPE